jgi:hypothetical protein
MTALHPAPLMAGFYRPKYKFLEAINLALYFWGNTGDTLSLRFLQTIPLHGIMFHCGKLNLPELEA